MNNAQNPHSPDPQDPITVTLPRCLLRGPLMNLLSSYVIASSGRWNYPDMWKMAYVELRGFFALARMWADAIGEWPTGEWRDHSHEWITLEEARERWGE